MSHSYAVYLLANQRNTVLYVGVTNNLERRVYEHKHKLLKGFTAKYNVEKLVYYEQTDNVEAAILREKQIKKYSRMKKDALINAENLEWNDLSLAWYVTGPGFSLRSK